MRNKDDTSLRPPHEPVRNGVNVHGCRARSGKLQIWGGLHPDVIIQWLEPHATDLSATVHGSDAITHLLYFPNQLMPTTISACFLRLQTNIVRTLYRPCLPKAHCTDHISKADTVRTRYTAAHEAITLRRLRGLRKVPPNRC